MERLTFEMLLITGVVLSILLGVYNTVMQARKYNREERQLRNQPTLTMEEKIRNHEVALAADKRRLDRLELDMKDTRDGQKYMVRGIQALLEHELHNGNANQMQSASDDLSKWLTSKI